MFGLLKFLFYSCVAVVVGVVIGTVPFGGRTIAERIAAVYQPSQTVPVVAPRKTGASKAVARAAPRSKGAQVASASAPKGPISAGAANSPDGHTDTDQAGLNQLLAAKAKAR